MTKTNLNGLLLGLLLIVVLSVNVSAADFTIDRNKNERTTEVISLGKMSKGQISLHRHLASMPHELFMVNCLYHDIVRGSRFLAWVPIFARDKFGGAE